MKKRIGVLGGSFDPVHKGHKALARAALSELQLDKLIIMPANIQPFKQDWKVTEPKMRLEMLKIAFRDDPNVDVSDYEITAAGVSYTYDTLAYIKRVLKGEADDPHFESLGNDDFELIFIMGTDSLLTFDSWYKGKEMLGIYSLAVSSRPGYRLDELNFKLDEYRSGYGACIYRLSTPMPDISSTEVRNAVREAVNVNMNADSLDIDLPYVEQEIIDFILKNKLYVNI